MSILITLINNHIPGKNADSKFIWFLSHTVKLAPLLFVFTAIHSLSVIVTSISDNQVRVTVLVPRRVKIAYNEEGRPMTTL